MKLNFGLSQEILDEADILGLRDEGLTDRGLKRIYGGDMRCRPSKAFRERMFDKYLPQFRLESVVDAARAEDIILLWAYVTGRQEKLAKNQFRFEHSTYMKDAALVTELKTMGNSADAMEAYLKQRYGTVRKPKRQCTKPLEEEEKQAPIVVEKLQKEKSLHHYVSAFGQDTLRALHKAAWDGQVSVTVELAERFGSFECPLRFGISPLHQAVFGNSVLVAERLIQQGASVDAKDDAGRTPLYHAARRPHGTPLVELLLSKGADPNAMAIDGSTPLHCASGAGNLEAVILLLGTGANESEGCTALHWAARAGHADIVQHLVFYPEFEPNARDWHDSTPLHMAVDAFRDDLPEDRRKAFVATIRYLMGKGADKNAVDADGRTVLHRAVLRGNVTCLKMLVGLRVDTSCRDRMGHTPWDLAAEEKVATIKEILNVSKDGDQNGSSVAWNDMPWMDHVQSVVDCVRRTGRIPTAYDEDAKDRFLGRWCALQRRRRDDLSPEQRLTLEGVRGWTWNLWREPVRRALNQSDDTSTGHRQSSCGGICKIS